MRNIGLLICLLLVLGCKGLDLSSLPEPAPEPPPPIPEPQPEPEPPPIVTPDDGEVMDRAVEFHFPAIKKGRMSIWLRGMKRGLPAQRSGESEYFAVSLYGEGFKRSMLANMEGSRGLRWWVDPGRAEESAYPNADDECMDWHLYECRWGEGKMGWYMDGEALKDPEGFTGAVNHIIAGGFNAITGDRYRRNFLGQWRDCRWESTE